MRELGAYLSAQRCRIEPRIGTACRIGNSKCSQPAGEFLRLNSRPHLLHEALIEAQVMDCRKRRRQDFVAPIQMMQVGAGKVLAGIAGTGNLDWLFVVFESRVADPQHATGNEQMAIASVPSGHHAVE